MLDPEVCGINPINFGVLVAIDSKGLGGRTTEAYPFFGVRLFFDIMGSEPRWRNWQTRMV
ncbi:hypothetical protein CMO96_01750 [Candidatus Woesebacteria bacterium]|nr:hypothetical protein [Candidatus Woesebacteria bacterium]